MYDPGGPVSEGSLKGWNSNSSVGVPDPNDYIDSDENINGVVKSVDEQASHPKDGKPEAVVTTQLYEPVAFGFLTIPPVQGEDEHNASVT